MAEKKLVLIDGSAFIYRAYFALPHNLSTSTGLPTNAIFGFASMFRKLFGGRRPEYGAVVFDTPAPTHRKQQYSEYKANRPPMEDQLSVQLPWIDRLVAAEGLPALRLPGYEADDVIGTLTDRATTAGMEVVIVSSDKDFAQLISERVTMFDSLRDISYDPELVLKKWGVRPDQIADLLGLMGDEQDNIPGVTGIGQKGAATLLATYGSLEGIYEHLGELKGKQRAALESQKEVAFLSKSLATIDRQAPIEAALESLLIPPAAPEALNELYRSLELYSFLSAEDRARSEVEEVAVRRPETEADRAAFLETCASAPWVVIHPLIGEGPEVGGALLGVAVLPSGGGPWWLEPEDPALPTILANPTIPKIFHDLQRALVAFAGRGYGLTGARADVMLASFLIEPTKIIPHRLEDLAREYLHRTVPTEKDRTALLDDRAALARHGARLAAGICELWPILEEKLAAADQRKNHDLVDLPLALLLGRMQRTGIKVDRADLGRLGEELRVELQSLEARAHAVAGGEFNLGSTKQLAKVLFEDLKLPVIKRTKTGYSTDSEVLERLAPKHELPRLVLEHRRVAKLINTYTDVLQAAVHERTGRIHARFQQTTSATGRLISTDPDLQRTPTRTAEGRRIRRAFVAEPGNLMLSADWSQIELRLLAHFSADPILVEAMKNGEDVHRRTASRLLKIAPEAVTAEARTLGKTINFATIYGQGASALAQILHIERAEAEAHIAEYFRTYAGVEAWLRQTIAAAHQNGFVTTLLGRRRYVPELSSRNPIDRAAGERIAANTVIQGSAADLCKLAMLEIDRRLQAEGLSAQLVLQIHDELLYECPTDQVEPARVVILQVMQTVRPLEVPLVAELGIGPTWGDAH
ncbi:MAG: DNA polymerase I [Deltaproteobacteria bacterium]|nr:DNA polymerase I [Deltaproteobacteria bacterium]